MENEQLQIGLKEYYLDAYPTDSLGYEIDESKTFEDLEQCLESYGDVYDLIGVADSLVRERLFEKLDEILGKGFGHCYNQWMRAVSF